MANASSPFLASSSSPGVHANTVVVTVGIIVCLWIIVAHSTIFACYVINRSQPWITYSKQILSLSLNDLSVGFVGLIILFEISMPENIIPYGVCSASFYFYLSSFCTNLYHVFVVCIHRAMILVKNPSTVAPTGTRISALLFLIGWIPAFVLCGIAFALWTEDRGDIRVCVVTRIFGDQIESAMAFIAAIYLIPLICTNIVYGVTFYKLTVSLRRTFPIQTVSANNTTSTSHASGQTSDKVLGHPPGQSSGKAPGQIPGQAQGQLPEQASGHATGHAPGQSHRHGSVQAPGQAPGHASGQETGQSPGKTSGKAPGQIPGQSPGQASGQAPGHAFENAQGQKTGQAPGLAPRQTPGQTATTMSSNAYRTGQAPTTMTSNANRPGMLAQRRATVTIGLLLLFFNLFSLPLIMVLCVLAAGGEVDRNVRVSLSHMFGMNCVTSPFVYALRVKNLGQTLKKCIPCYSRHAHTI